MKRTRKTSTKAEKTAAKATNGRKTRAKAPTATTVNGTQEKAQGEKAPAAPKHPAVPEGGQIMINEAVGVHFRCTPADAPKENETVIITFGDSKVVLVARAVTATKDGNRLVQAFVQKGSGDYAKLAPAKGKLATWKRGAALPAKEKKANGK
jgi:hypothetical protein